jgi:glycosyl transferase family 25
VGYFVFDANHSNAKPSFLMTKGVGVGAYIINLNRSKERYECIKKHLNGLGLNIERIEAVDGSTLSQEEIDKKVDLESYRTFFLHSPKRGTIGCSLSHIKVWERFLQSDFEFAMIFEDDVSFDPKNLKIVIDDLVKNKELWDIVSFEIHRNGRIPLTIKKLVNDHHLCVFLTKATHSGAYMINRKGAKNLLEKALPIKMPVDHYFTRDWELGIKFTGVENPNLVHQTFGDSDIKRTTKVQSEKISAITVFHHTLYVVQSYVIRFFHNLKVYLSERM